MDYSIRLRDLSITVALICLSKDLCVSRDKNLYSIKPPKKQRICTEPRPIANKIDFINDFNVVKKLITSQKQKKSCRSDFCGIFSTNCRFFNIEKEMKKNTHETCLIIDAFFAFLASNFRLIFKKRGNK